MGRVLFLELHMLSWMCHELLSIEVCILGLVFAYFERFNHKSLHGYRCMA